MKIVKYIFAGSHLITIILIVLLYNILAPVFSPLDKIYPDHVNKILYIDRKFTTEEVAIIVEAAVDWSKSTNNIVNYKIIIMPTRQAINYQDGIIIVKLSPDDPHVLMLDDFDGRNLLGYFNEEGISYIALVSDNIGTNHDRYRSVILHELGHSLGLKHVTGIDGIGTLMYPSAEFGADDITASDLINFCKLYHCDASTLKH